MMIKSLICFASATAVAAFAANDTNTTAPTAKAAPTAKPTAKPTKASPTPKPTTAPPTIAGTHWIEAGIKFYQADGENATFVCPGNCPSSPSNASAVDCTLFDDTVRVFDSRAFALSCNIVGGPTPKPSAKPSKAPTTKPPTASKAPTTKPPTASKAPTKKPTTEPPTASKAPTKKPTTEPPTASKAPTKEPTTKPPTASKAPTKEPTTKPPTASKAPSAASTHARRLLSADDNAEEYYVEVKFAVGLTGVPQAAILAEKLALDARLINKNFTNSAITKFNSATGLDADDTQAEAAQDADGPFYPPTPAPGPDSPSDDSVLLPVVLGIVGGVFVLVALFCWCRKQNVDDMNDGNYRSIRGD